MPDHSSGQIFKKKALDRWENEGGRIFADQTERIKNGSPNKDTNKDNAEQIFKNPPSDRLNGRK